MMARPKYNILFFLIASFFFYSSYVHSQASDPCGVALARQATIPFDTTVLRCASVWSSQNFVLRYVQDAPNVWNFVLTAPNPNSYIGMGFSSNGRMVGSSAMVGWVGSDSNAVMRKFYLGGQTSNQVVIEPSNQGLQIRNDSISVQSNQIYMAFQLITSTPPTRIIYSVGPSGRLPSASNPSLVEHRDFVATTINLVTGQFQTQSSTHAGLRRSHGLLNMFGWAIFLPIGAMIARYMRNWDPIWFYSHAVVQSFGFILGLTGVVCGLVLEEKITASVTKHKGLGIFILALGCLQVMAILIRPNKEAKVRKYWNWYHFGVGRLLVFLAAINVFYGIHLAKAGSAWNAGFASVLIIFFIITLILELRLCLKK